MGLDIGISSVGWGLLELNQDGMPSHIIDTGVRIFSPGENVKTGESKNLKRREKRGSGRLIRRRGHRVDRIEYLLNQHGYLGDIVKSEHISDSYDIIEKEFEKMICNYYKNNNKNPYQLKVEGLTRRLTDDELSIILVHYGKHRGYQANRDEADDKETGKLKTAIAENENIMKNEKYKIVSEMFISDSRFSDRIRNSSGDYKMAVTRQMYFDEINMVLDKQIEFGLIDEKFKNEYLEIWKSQRNYAKGPGGQSKYGGNLIEKMTGKCKFTNEPRAPKGAPSAEIFVALEKLLNFRYRDDDEYKKLTSEQIKMIIEMAKTQDKLTYAKVSKELGLEFKQIKGLSLTGKQYGSFVNKFKEKVLKLSTKEKFDFSELDEKQKELYRKSLEEEINKRVFVELKKYSEFRKIFVKLMGNDEWKKIKDDYEFLDKIAVILTNYKTSEDIILHLKEENIDEKYYGVVLELPTLRDHIMLSLSLLYKLNPLLLEGHRYDEAMELLGYNFSDLVSDKEKFDLLIPMNQDNEIKNQRVLRSLAQTRKIVNSVIKRYGMPEQINVETTRELAKTMRERKLMTKRMEENKERNAEIKRDILFLFPNKFKSIDDVKSTDLLKYKLWKEQNGKCGYSMETISIDMLYDNNLVQIDHILPYSRTYNDNYLNKTLVLSKCNQDKGNKTPYEWFGKTEKWNQYKNFINGLNISQFKKDNYLLVSLTSEMENDMRNQNLNDTKYISRYLVTYLKQYLNVNKVASVNGVITGKLRAFWGLNGLTHSLQSRDYYLGNEVNKNRENHLHHAMDALVIASVTPSLTKRITSYEKYSRYVNGKTDEQLLKIAKDLGEDISIEEVKQMLKDKYIQKKQNGKNILLFPTPYEQFVDELKLRVYEQDRDAMMSGLRHLSYSDAELDGIYPIIPSFAKNKISGPLHGETYYGIRKNGDEIKTTERIDITSSRFKRKLLDKIIDKDAGSKEIYETLASWLGNDENMTGDIAFKEKGYPINSKTGNMIKKIKIAEEYKNTGHIINGKVVARENIYVIEVYKKKNDNNLYFVGLDQMDLINKKRNIDFPIIIWWGQGQQNKSMLYNEILDEFDAYIDLRKDELVRIYKKTGESGMGYVTGFSSGMLEIRSCLGDGYDLVGDDLLFKENLDRFKMTISTIEKIEKIKLSALGKIE